MMCPNCSSDGCRRSHREGSRDFVLGLTGLRPWRCRECDTRFFAWSVPIKYLHYARCGQCGNLDLKRISREYVSGHFAWLFRSLLVPAYRCAPCRNKFFSIRRRLRVVRATEASETESAAAPPS
jgi:DNA-directed RNA polymerase subunit RPC12/RpoP